MKKNKKEKKKNYKKIILIICFILFIYFIGGIVFCVLKKNISTTKVKVDTGVSIKGFEYILYKSHPQLYKDEFKVLKSNLEKKTINYDEYAKSISKMFLIDLYNINNKKNMYDVGGVVFVYPDARDNYKLNVINTLYKYVKNNNDGKRKQELPEVKSVEIINLEDNKYTIDEDEYDGYKLNLHIEYVKDLGYDKDAEIIIIKQDKYLYIVEKNNIYEKKDIQ